MEIKTTDKQYYKAQRRVARLKSFYFHAVVYFLVNLIISIYKIIKYYNRSESMFDSIFNFDTFFLWFAWGIAILLHAFSIFGLDRILGKNWEERKIEKFMEEENLKQ